MGQSDLFHWFNGGRLDLPKGKGRHHRLHSQVRAPTGKHLLPVRTKWKIHVNYNLSEARDECCHSPDSGGTLPPSLPRNRTRRTICHPLGRQSVPDYSSTSEPISPCNGQQSSLRKNSSVGTLFVHLPYGCSPFPINGAPTATRSASGPARCRNHPPNHHPCCLGQDPQYERSPVSRTETPIPRSGRLP
jgi:hypothetical protein